MLYSLSEYLTQFYGGFNVFQYLTMRTILGVLTALLISLIVGPVMINYLSSYKIGQSVRADGPESHFSKAGTPTMGGALILVAIVTSTLLWSDLSSRFVWIILFVTVGFGVIGWVDDPEHYPIAKKRHTFEYLRGVAHLRPRTNTFGAISRVRNAIAMAVHGFLQSRSFQWVNTPIITSSDCEGAGEGCFGAPPAVVPHGWPHANTNWPEPGTHGARELQDVPARLAHRNHCV